MELILKFLITGGAGYIGSHAVVELLDKGHDVIVIDNLETGHEEFLDKRAVFYNADLRDISSIDNVFKKEKIDIVMHFAAYIKVGESVSNPLKYYRNNTFGIINLLECMKNHSVKNIIFSSTAAVYGEVDGSVKVDEKFKVEPINPYGMSKAMSERIISDSAEAYGIKYVIFRYFNVTGAHEKYNIGQLGDGITALTSRILDVAIGKQDKLLVFGNDYPTKDGTGVRDYIHVKDLVNAHILAALNLDKFNNCVYNLGNGNGFTVFEMIEAAEKVTGCKVAYEVVKRRDGDPASVVADSSKIKEELHWDAEYKTMESIIRTVWAFKQKNA